MKKTILLASFVLMFSLVLGACQSPGEKLTEKASEKIAEKAIENASGGNADVDINDNNVNVQTKEGNMNIGENVSLPADFPKDVYVYEGTIKAVFNTVENNGHTVSIETDKPVADIKADYEKKIVEDGWEKTGTMDFGNSVSITGKKDKRNLSVMISNSDNKTTIVLGVYEDK